METSPLTLAKQHARSAEREFSKANGSGASQEHELAAESYARVARDTENSEAQRMLKLLEDHHHRLASIIKGQPKPKPAAPSPDKTDDVSAEPASPPSPLSADNAPTATTLVTSPPAKAPSGPASPTFTRANRKPRELSSSIVSSLATARGKPGSGQRYGLAASPEVSRHTAGGRITSRLEKLNKAERELSPESRRRSAQTKPIPEEPTSPPAELPGPRGSTEEAFSRFYSTFSPLISALSPALAFAGLPLTPDDKETHPYQDNPPVAPASPRKPKNTTRAKATDDPEVSHLFSRAALRALKEDAQSNGHGPFGQESFYVVPTTGGTVSYAGIASRSTQNLHDNASRHPETIEEETDEFVDARENLGPPSPRYSKHGGTTKKAGPPQRVGGRKTDEEWATENAHLKKDIDRLSHRLMLWETTSQRQSMAMTQSFASIAPPVQPQLMHATGEEAGMASVAPPSTNRKSRPVQAERGESDGEQVKLLQKELEAMKHEREENERRQERLQRENEKLQQYLGRYREKWEGLKNSARERRERDRDRGKDGSPALEGEGDVSGK